MAMLFPDRNLTPSPIKGYTDTITSQQNAEQEIMASRLADIQNQRQQLMLDESRRDVPNAGLQRQLQQSVLQGQIGRQPNINRREGALASAAATPERIAAAVESGQLDEEAKVRKAKMSKEADHAETFIQAFEPVLKASSGLDFEGTNAAWENAFNLMEKSGYDTSKYRVMDRGKLLPEIKKQYDYSVNNASAIRERVKAEQAHKRRLEEIAAQEKTRVAAARERALAEKPVNSPNAVVSRIMDKYRKDPKSLNDTERDTLRDWYENNLTGADQTDYEFAFTQPERDAIRRRNAARIRRMYPDLYRSIPRVDQRTTQKFDAQGNPIK